MVKLKRFAIAIVLVILVAGAGLLRHRSPQAIPISTNTPVIPANASTLSISASTPPPSGLATAQKQTVFLAVQADSEARARQYQAAFRQSLDLYGVVLEAQSEQPIADATVEFGPIDHPGIGSTQSAHTIVHTDAQGRFAFTDHQGLDLSVQVSKFGFYTLRNDSYAMFTHDGESAAMHRRAFVTDPAQPARLYLRQAGPPAAKLISRKLSQEVPRDGSPSEIRLANGHSAAVGTGDLRVECTSNDEGVHGGTPFDWNCRVSVPNGGLQVRTDAFLFEAPEAGYQPGEDVSMPAALGKGQWQGTLRRDYFLRLADGRYARTQIEVHPGDHHLFYLTYYLNPSPGDRNLEAVADTQPKSYR